MVPRNFLPLFLLFSSWISPLAFSVVAADSAATGNSPPCVQKLMPCQPYLHATTTPPAGCCMPLLDVIKADPVCLCQLFNNAAILKSFNLTQEEALKLPKSCGALIDLDVCKKASAAPSGSPTTPTTATPSNSSSTTTTTTTTDKKSAASWNTASLALGGSIILFIVNLIF